DPGFLKAYVESSDDESAETDDAERRLPNLRRDQELAGEQLNAVGHSTQPPARYTEASLVKALEELGIGRPSTYASIMQTIQDRGYVVKRSQALVPSFLAFAVVGLLEQYFSRLVDYSFTAAMEDQLDTIATGDALAVDFLRAFYFGGDHGAEGSVSRAGGLKKLVTDKLAAIDARGVNSIPLHDSEQGPVVVRVGRYGPYLQRGEGGGDAGNGARAPLPDGIAPDELTPEKVEELFRQGSGERKLGEHPESGETIVVKSGRYGPYVQCGEKSSSLLKAQSIEDLTLADALQLLTLPRVVGATEDGQEVLARAGRYGPYLTKGEDSRSLEREEQLFTVTMEQALELFAQPKARSRRAAAAPLRELGDDPETGKPMVLKEGRFGPYVTDGETNASLRRSDSVDEITVERAAELLAERRAKGPATPRKKAAAKKAA
ncbi:MAG: topoisomerase C-terminal repeat-containing protein, partial [Micromonosporaceae bacterium]